jgi:hypothetical protein
VFLAFDSGQLLIGLHPQLCFLHEHLKFAHVAICLFIQLQLLPLAQKRLNQLRAPPSEKVRLQRFRKDQLSFFFSHLTKVDLVDELHKFFVELKIAIARHDPVEPFLPELVLNQRAHVVVLQTLLFCDSEAVFG